MRSSSTAKHDELRKNGTFNHRADDVSAELFVNSRFFDAHDLVQVKYEMLRAVEIERSDVSSASAMFGFSRVSFYKIKKAFDENGVLGLTTQKRGPKGSRKVTEDDIKFARSLINTHTKSEIMELLKEERGVEISKRTLERQMSDKKNP